MNSILQSPTNNIQESLDFYKKLNFKNIVDENRTLVTDGKVIIEINPVRFARAGVKLYKESWTEEVSKLKMQTAITEIENGFLLSGASGVWIYLMEGAANINYQLEENCFGLPGNFAGMSLETTDITRSAAIWQILGFKQTMGSVEQGWIAYQNSEDLGVSLMKPMACPHLFFNPSVTYFNGGKNLPIIENIRKAGIPITEEITVFNKENIVDNIIIRDPGGYGFFIFND